MVQAIGDEFLYPGDLIGKEFAGCLDDGSFDAKGVDCSLVYLGVRECGIEEIEGSSHLSWTLHQYVRPRDVQLESGTCHSNVRGKFRDQAEEGCHPRVLDECHAAVLDQSKGVVGVAGGKCVVDSLAEHIVVGKPVRGDPVKFFATARMEAFEAAMKEIGKEVVIPEPVPVVIDALQKQVSAFDFLEHLLAGWNVCQQAGEVTADLLRDGGGQEELEDCRLERAQDVLHQVFVDGMVASGKMRDEVHTIATPA
ncbi:hypothetical protein [Rhodococcus koreensis]|uniref:hypothetical protein n=1 Tax=Rhodococcus koreensis TaxID=99653 RepID=UPI001FC9CD66|nr:hypothetical protein [Rhodococcus koreensis]